MLAPCDRSAIWLGKTIGVTLFLVLAEVVALPAFALFFHPLSWELVAAVALADIGIAAIGTLLGCDRRREPGARAAAAAALPAARDPGRRSAASARASPANPGTFLAFLGLYDAVFAILSWASFEYVVTE